MDEIVSVSVYKEISALTGDKTDKKKDIFDPDHVRICAPQSHQICQVMTIVLLAMYCIDIDLAAKEAIQ
ncbi:hypothetical protein ANCDUO_04670 [Ancylostoma duodenale]|uniref:Uncharacterized protein n=1 Tax=Ancylostoma duodenale TaxID=51022 RepID=A0A0C2H0G0_9BILA|nr:hypothetical protein ANCDUO_04670 [Ancylostoma duodenale]